MVNYNPFVNFYSTVHWMLQRQQFAAEGPAFSIDGRCFMQGSLANINLEILMYH
jgi:hypothetical protein